jgi:hypothetical protein
LSIASQRVLVNRFALALADDCSIVDEAEPREILQDRLLEFDARALSIAILDAQQTWPPRPASLPDMQGVKDVAEVQIPVGAGQTVSARADQDILAAIRSLESAVGSIAAVIRHGLGV